MILKITAKNMDGEIRVLEEKLIADSVNRALQMYDKDLREDETLYYEIID